MKIQNMAIIFIIIILPISLMLSSFTKTQIDAISIQTLYATKVRDATYDAVTAFQLNTADNKYSTVSDSMRRDVTAAIQTFISNLAKNLGMSGVTENTIKPYIPAIIFTLYDGYYIYAPSFSYGDLTLGKDGEDAESGYSTTDVSKKTYDDRDYELNPDGTIKMENGKPVYKTVEVFEVNDSELNTTEKVISKVKDKTSEEYEHVLTPYIYYTSRYKGQTTDGKEVDVTVNYSLDNYIVIYGQIDNEEITKSGYLIDPVNIPEIDEKEVLTRNLPVTTIAYTNNDNRSMINDQAIITTELQEVPVTSAELLYDRLSNTPNRWIRDVLSVDGSSLRNEANIDDNAINKYAGLYKMFYKKSSNPDFERKKSLGWFVGVNSDNDKSSDYYVDAQSAKEFYREAKEFTEWVNTNLGNIKASEAIRLNDIYKQNKTGTDLFGDEKVFLIDEKNDPEDPASAFNTHKREIIKQSIEDNLAQAIASYNKHSEALHTTYNFKIPVLSETEWDKVLTNVTMITFVQGLQAGTKMYNDYAIVTSTNNKEYVSPESIYYINTSDTDNKQYHRLGCSELIKNDNDNIVGYRSSDFERQTYEYEDFKTDDNENRLTDDNGNQLYKDTKNFYYMHPGYEACYYCIVNSTKKSDKNNMNDHANLKKAYYTALAREKYNFYKVNSYLREAKPPIDNPTSLPGSGTENIIYNIDDISREAAKIQDIKMYIPKSNEINKFPLVIIEEGNNINWNSIKDKFSQKNYAICTYSPQASTSEDKKKELKYLLYYLKSKHYVDENNVFVIASGDNAAFTAESVGDYKSDLKALILISPEFISGNWTDVFKFNKNVLLIKGKNEINTGYDYAKDRYNIVSSDETISYGNVNSIGSSELTAMVDSIVKFLNLNRRFKLIFYNLSKI